MFEINSSHWTLDQVEGVLKNNLKLSLSDDSVKAITKCRDFLDAHLKDNQNAIYGINTGFGSLCDTVISSENLSKLQENLVKSHACGLGNLLSSEQVKLMLLFKIKGLSLGHSGVKIETVQRLVDFYNNDILPAIPEQGSLGASGDLAPLAHLSLPLLGMGKVHFQGKLVDSQVALNAMGWKPLVLGAKEGLALLNGTQFMSAMGVYTLLKARRLFRQSLHIAAAAIDAFQAKSEPFNELLHQIRHQPGQLLVAQNINHILADSEIFHEDKSHVQDPYSFRCIPQVLGAVFDQLQQIIFTFEAEINSVTDNPTIFPDEKLILSGGNFHGEPLAFALDQLAIVLSELASISERRTYKLISGNRNLPAFLVANPGLNSGFMIPQYVAASLVSQNKQLATPSSVDSIDSSNGQEDHVSMGANAALKALKVCENTQKVLAIEWLNAAQALDFLSPKKSGSVIEKTKSEFREVVRFVEEDTIMNTLMEEAVMFLEKDQSF